MRKNICCGQSAFFFFLLMASLILISNAEAEDFVFGQVLLCLKEKPLEVTSQNEIIKTSNLPNLNEIFQQYEVFQMQKLIPYLKFKNSANANLLDNLYLIKSRNLTYSATVNLKSALEQLPETVFADFDTIRDLQIFPNDLEFEKQWHLHNEGQTGGTLDADIDSPESWDISLGNKNIAIAISDTGTSLDHEDLADNIWINSDEIPNNGIDDDQNGYIDDVNGWDFSDDDNDPNDYGSHGTHVSGIASAVTNNNLGVTGVSYNCAIMPIKIFPNAYTSKIIPAIIYSADNDAKVLNMSWGSYSASQSELEALEYAYENDVFLCAAAGNDNIYNKLYPAGFECVMAVGATDHNDQKASFSNFGGYLEVCAPGVQIYSTVPMPVGYDHFDGTSMASPVVAGLAGLVRSWNPVLSVTEVRGRIRGTTDNIDINLAGILGSGRVNADHALSYQDQPRLALNSLNMIINSSEKTLKNVAPGDEVKLSIEVKNWWKDANQVQVSLDSDNAYIIITDNSSELGSILSEEEANNEADPFLFKIDESTPYPYQIPMKLSITAAGGYENIYEFKIAVEGPQPIVEIWTDPNGTYPTHYNNGRNIAVNSQGILFAVFIADNAMSVRTARSDDNGQTWLVHEAISDPQYKSDMAAVAISPDDLIHLVWQQVDPAGNEEIFYSFSADAGVTYSVPVIISTWTDAPRNCLAPAIATDTENGVHVVWNRLKNNSVDSVFYAYKSAGSKEFLVPVIVSGELLGGYASVECASDNLPRVVWANGDSWFGGEDLFLVQKLSDGTWISPENVTNTAETRDTSPSLVIDENDICHVVYYSGTSFYINNSSGEWGVPIRLTDGSSTGFPNLTIDSEGHLWAAWEQSSAVRATRNLGAGWEPAIVVSGAQGGKDPTFARKVNNSSPHLIFSYGKKPSTIASLYFDAIPPAKVNDLEAWQSGTDYRQIILRFTAPGDDGFEGQAAHYYIRISTEPIETDADFLESTVIENDFVPSEGGTSEELVILMDESIPDNWYYITLKARDDSGNVSQLSNNAYSYVPVELSYFTASLMEGKILLQWGTESEFKNLGWNVYRSAGSRSPISTVAGFVKINGNLIPGAGNSSTTQNYSFWDDDVEFGNTYRYYLEDVSYSGQTGKSQIIEITVLP